MSKAKRDKSSMFVNHKRLGVTIYTPRGGFPYHNITTFYFQTGILELEIPSKVIKVSKHLSSLGSAEEASS